MLSLLDELDDGMEADKDDDGDVPDPVENFDEASKNETNNIGT